MRDILKRFHGERWAFTGVFRGFGEHRYRRFDSVRAVKLSDLRAGGETVARSIMVNSSAEFVALGLKEGDAVKFEARIVFEGDRLRLRNPSKVAIIERTAQVHAEPLPLFDCAEAAL